MAYDAKDPGIDDGMMLSAFEHPTPLDEGYYILTAGTRLEDGTALTHSEFFTIKAGETIQVELVLRKPKTNIEVIGKLNFRPDFIKTEGCYILGILDQGSEPTTHAMQDIAAFKKDFEKNGTPMFFVFNNNEEHEKFILKNFTNLPNNIIYCVNKNISNNIIKEINTNNTLPIFILVNENNEVVFLRQGYTIGLGEQLLKTLLKTL